MGKVILFGGIGENFPDLSCKTLFNNEKLTGSMTMLLQNEEIAAPFNMLSGLWGNYAPSINMVLLSDPEWEQKVIDVLESTSLILIGPGKTMVYREAISHSDIGARIAKRVSEGVAYAGISAGAMLAGERLARDTEAGVAVFPALGLLKGICVEPHYDSPGKEASLKYQMMSTGLHAGLGIGNTMCAVIADGSGVVSGKGACVLVQDFGDGVSKQSVYEHGNSFCF